MIRRNVDLIAIALLLASVGLLSSARQAAVTSTVKAAMLEPAPRCFIVRAVQAVGHWAPVRVRVGF